MVKKGTKLTTEHKQKIGIALKKWCKKRGYVPAWNKGKKTSLEVRRKQRKAKLKNPVRYWLGKKRPDVGEKIALKLRGRVCGRGEKSRVWKGGTGSWWRTQARIKMEENIGRRLKSSEIVHHIDGDFKNNSLGNLVITNRSVHCKIHKPNAK